jgi:hypothetical protein
MAKPLIAYPEVFAAIGRFIAKEKMGDVCVMEFEAGMIITGSVPYSTGETLTHYTETKVLSFEDLQRLAKER